MPLNRREFVHGMITGPFAITLSLAHAKKVTAKEQDFVGISIAEIREGEDLFSYIQRVKGGFDPRLYRQILGAANAFKEGDQFIGVAATDEQSAGND